MAMIAHGRQPTSGNEPQRTQTAPLTPEAFDTHASHRARIHAVDLRYETRRAEIVQSLTY